MKQQIPIKVINLEWSKDRRSFIEEQLNKLDLRFDIVKAVDGNNLGKDDIEKYSKKAALNIKGRELSKGEIGAALSHINLWKQMIEENLQYVLVLEDDAMIGEILQKIIALENPFPEDWELINFTTDWKLIPFGKTIFDIYRMARIKGISNRSSAYLINRKGAEKLYTNSYPIRLPIDDLIGRTDITGLVLYSIHPQIASFMDFKSDTWKYSDRKKLKTTFSFKAKRICNKTIQILNKIKNRV